MGSLARRIMFMVAGFEGLRPVLCFAGTGRGGTGLGKLVYGNFILWGVLDLVIALIALYAGVDLLRGGAFGIVMGYLFAGLAAIRWFFVIPAAPILAVVVIALCVMVIYALATHPDYSQSA